jgi:hypothetical protein
VLTVDDSTRSGAEACLIARELGHEVLFFINPEPVVSGVPYFFSLFDTFVDARRFDVIEAEDGQRIHIGSRAEIRDWWWSLRSKLMVLDADQALFAVRRIGMSLGCADVELPDHLKPLTCSELAQLRDAGVQIENHGWTHVDLAGMTREKFRDHFERARRWLQDELNIPAEWYASPFGRTVMPREWLALLDRPYFLADSRQPCGAPLAPGAINRHDISDKIEAAG